MNPEVGNPYLSWRLGLSGNYVAPKVSSLPSTFDHQFNDEIAFFFTVRIAQISVNRLLTNVNCNFLVDFYPRSDDLSLASRIAASLNCPGQKVLGDVAERSSDQCHEATLCKPNSLAICSQLYLIEVILSRLQMHVRRYALHRLSVRNACARCRDTQETPFLLIVLRIRRSLWKALVLTKLTSFSESAMNP